MSCIGLLPFSLMTLFFDITGPIYNGISKSGINKNQMMSCCERENQNIIIVIVNLLHPWAA